MAEKEIVQVTHYIERKMKRHYCVGIGVAVLMGLLMIGLPAWYLSSKKEEIQNVQYNDKMQKAMKQYEFRLCGKELCIKENQKALIWKDPKTKEKYYIVK